MKKRITISLVVIFFFCISILAESKIEIKLGVTPGMGEPIRKLFVELYSEAGVNAVIKELPTARLMNEFDKGTIDAVLFASDYAIKKRHRAITIGLEEGNPLFTFKLYGYVLSTRIAEFNKAITYKNYAIAYIQGNQAHENAITELGAKPVPVLDYGNALNMLVAGRVDMIFAVPGALIDYFALTGINSKLVAMTQKPLAAFNYFHVLDRQYWDLAKKLQIVFKHTEEKIKKIFSGSQ
ncbi:MAG TPA: hypothetical protein PK074_03165 [Spirochaetales bacterium]|nr:hypothetical protein [Spirochaetales bacterium]HQG40868.1 hypothetical protein [Spirochaetales bacterium]HQK33697.1 hypothetical protein [Spirochaetales bacterium]